MTTTRGAHGSWTYVRDPEPCQWTGCEAEAEGTRTDGTQRRRLCLDHLAITSRDPVRAMRELDRRRATDGIGRGTR